MTSLSEDETGIDKDFFLARVQARQRQEAAAKLEEVVGYSTDASVATPTSTTPRRQAPPRIPPLKLNGLFGHVPESPDSSLAARVKADADEMYKELDEVRELSPLDRAVDEALAGLDVLTSYSKWIGKMQPKVYDGQTESIMISCPIPGHEDAAPSAWINSVKGDGGVWHCGGCQRGGDKYDLAAVGLGYNMFQYKTDGTFRQLKLDMARAIGVDVDSYLLGPAAKAYLAQQKEEHQKVDTPEAHPAEQITRARPAEPEASIPRPSAPVDPLVAMHLASAEEYNKVTRKYYNKKSDEGEEASPPPAVAIPVQVPGIARTSPQPPEPEREATAQESTPSATGPVSAVSSKGEPPPPVAGLGGLFGAATSPPPASMLADDDEEQKPPPGFKPLTRKPPMGIGLVPGMGGLIQVKESDPGLIKAMLEDEGIKTEEPETSDREYDFTPLDFRALVPDGTFLHKYCITLVPSSSPDEWNFWNGVAGLSVAVGKRIGLRDTVKPVYSNLYVCLLGETTAGKSVAKSFILDLIRKTMPWIANDPTNTAPRLVVGAASGEKLIDKLRNEIKDPAKPGSVLEVLRVAGLVEYDELATVMAKSSGPSSNFIPILQGLFDGYGPVESSSFTTGDKIAPDPFATMLTSTQPSMLQRLVGREHIDNGFMNRFVFAPATGKIIPKEQMLGGEAISVDPAGPYLRGVHEWAVANEGEVVGWDRAALNLGRDWLHDVVHPNKTNNGDNKLIQRTDLMMKKLMLIFTLNMRQSSVTVEAVQAAMQVYPYLMDSYRILDKSLTSTESSELREKILRMVGKLTAKNGGVPPTKKLIHDGLGRTRIDDDVLIRAIKNMVELGYLKQLNWPLPGMPQVGRKSVRYGLAADD